MIRRGKTEGWLQLPQNTFVSWATLNDVTFDRTVPGDIPGRGGALLAKEDPNAEEDSSNVLLTVPKDLILSLERVQDHAKVDKDFREVLQSLGDFGRVGLTWWRHLNSLFCAAHITNPTWVRNAHFITSSLTSSQTSRGAILSFLLEQASISCPDLPVRVGVHSPFTE